LMWFTDFHSIMFTNVLHDWCIHIEFRDWRRIWGAVLPPRCRQSLFNPRYGFFPWLQFADVISLSSQSSRAFAMIDLDIRGRPRKPAGVLTLPERNGAQSLCSSSLFFFELHNTSETLTTHAHSSLWIHAHKPYP
jgi:hypothetical protein